jgi:hypothetical protein
MLVNIQSFTVFLLYRMTYTEGVGPNNHSSGHMSGPVADHELSNACDHVSSHVIPVGRAQGLASCPGMLLTPRNTELVKVFM